MTQADPEPILSHVLPVERLVYQSPVACAGLFRCSPADPLFPAGAPCSSYCIVFPREAAWIQHEGARRFVADASLATLYNRGQVYRRWSIGNRPDHCDWLAFPAAVVRQAIQEWSELDADHDRQPFRFGAAPVPGALYVRQRLFFAALQRSPVPDSVAMDEEALWLLDAVVASAYSADGSRSRERKPSRQVVAAVEATRHMLARDPAARHSLPALATRAGLSPYHLCRGFRRVTGTTISRYRTELRLRASLEPVAAGHELTAVALGLGFTSHSHFTCAFRQAFGVVPSGLQRRLPGPRKAGDARGRTGVRYRG